MTNGLVGSRSRRLGYRTVDDDRAEHGGRDRLAVPVEKLLAHLSLDLEETLGQRGL
jgi:hypothetical protein